MVRVQRQLQLVDLLDGDQPPLGREKIDQRFRVGRFARTWPAEDDDVLPALDGESEKRVPVLRPVRRLQA
ncbi:hypothetical protein D3C77_767250 [compost metagenome]